jgi:HAD superfamily hydrolase (TIGR01484 family)
MERCRQVTTVFCDIDDTLTREGRLEESAFSALWQAHQAGLRLVPVTGRPAGWVDHLARMWPVDAVIGENGAFFFWMEGGKMRRFFVQNEEERILPPSIQKKKAGGKMRRFFVQNEEERQANNQRLARIGEEILREIPGAALSADQAYRAIDLAVDFCEDVPPLSREDIERIVAIFEEHGATAKISSIHVNGWFGDFDKRTACAEVAQRLWGIPPAALQQEAIYCGDSPNDEPMFAWFPLSVGVANVRNFLDRLQHPPAYITPSPHGAGFAELIQHLLLAHQE